MLTRIKNFLSETAECRSRYGNFAGARVWNALRQDHTRPRNELFTVKVPNLPHPVSMRAGRNDIGTFLQILVHEQGDLSLSKKPSFIIDAGANIGLTAIGFASRFPDARIVALEVDNDNFRVLEANCRHYPNVTCIKKALWGTAGFVRILDPTVDVNAYQVVDALPDDPGAIEATTINNILQTFSVETVDLLKVDIEGAEIELMATAGQWIHRVRVLAIETHDRMRPGCTQAITTRLAETEYRRTTHGEYDVFSFDR